MEILTDIGNKIGFEWHLALTHLINFLIIFFLLVKFALPSIKKVVSERTRKIQEGLKMREDADKIVAAANEKSLEISKKANAKVLEIFSQAENSAKEILLDANGKATEIIQLAEKEKQVAKENGLKDAENILSKDLPKILSKISASAFGEKLTPEVNAEFVSKVFKMQ